MSREDSAAERGWEQGWEEHKLAQLRRLAQLSMAEKLVWLEEAHRVVRHLAAEREARREDPGPPDRP